MIRKAIAALLLAGLTTAAIPARAEPPRPSATPARIDKNGLVTLLRGTILAVQQGNETGNYTVLRDLSAPAFQRVNSAARLGEIFADLRNRKFDLSGVAVLEPQLTVMPQIESNGMMRVAGVFPSAPMQVNFEILYAPVEGRWRPFGISVGVGSSNPMAPGPSASQPAPVAETAPVPRQVPSKKTVQKQPHARNEAKESPKDDRHVVSKTSTTRQSPKTVANNAPANLAPKPTPAPNMSTGLY